MEEAALHLSRFSSEEQIHRKMTAYKQTIKYSFYSQKGLVLLSFIEQYTPTHIVSNHYVACSRHVTKPGKKKCTHEFHFIGLIHLTHVKT